jgi:hypothetical protein
LAHWAIFFGLVKLINRKKKVKGPILD